jgi:hypothetical protein
LKVSAFLSAILVLATASPGQSLPDLAADERLKVPVSYGARLQPLSEVVSDLGRLTQVRLTTAADIGELKITLVCRERPAAEIMQKIAELMLFEWAEAGDGYRIFYPNAIAAEERSLVEAEDRLLKEQTKQQLDTWIEDSRRPLEDLLQELDQVREEWRSLPAHDPKKKLAEQRAARLQQYSQRHFYDLGFMLGQLDDRGWSRFWNGDTLIGSTGGERQLLRLPQGATITPIRIMTIHGESKPNAAYMAARFQPEAGLSLFSQFAVEDDLAGAKVSYAGKLFRRNVLDHPFLDRLTRWETPLRDETFSADLLPVLQRPIAQDVTSPKSPYTNRMLGASEHFLWLGEHADVCIVSDAFRIPIGFEERIPGDTVLSWILALGPEEGAVHQARHGRFRIEGDWIMFRHEQFWRRKQFEIPERLYRPLEAIAVRRAPHAREYAAFVAGTTDRQMMLFQLDYPLVRFATSPLTGAGHAFRFFGSLTEAQQQAARTTDGVSPLQMNAAQRDLYWRAVQESLWSIIIVHPRLRSAIMRAADPELEANMRFFFRDEQDGTPTVQIVNRQPYRADAAPEMGRAPSIQFLFGPSVEDAILYQTTLHTTPPHR